MNHENREEDQTRTEQVEEDEEDHESTIDEKLRKLRNKPIHAISPQGDKQPSQWKNTTPQPNQELQQIKILIQNQQRTIETLNERITKLEKSQDYPPPPSRINHPTHQPNLKNQHRTKPVTKQYIPAAPIDLEGNTQLETTRADQQPIDWAKVVVPRKKRAQRPAMSATMNEHVTDQLNKHVEEKYRGDDRPATRQQKEMSPDQRRKIIQAMLSKSGNYVGIGPISSDHIDRVDRILLSKGINKKTENPLTRKQKTIKSLIKSWCKKNLLMNDRDWDDLDIVNIIQAENSDNIVHPVQITGGSIKAHFPCAQFAQGRRN